MKSTRNIAVWIILGLLIIGLMGFGSGRISNNVDSLGSVGDQDVSVQAYGGQVQAQMRALSAQSGRNVTFAELQAAGIDQRILSQLIGNEVIENEASLQVISISDEEIAKVITQDTNFHGPNGFDRQFYRESLSRSNLREADYEDAVRESMAGNLIRGAVMAGASSSDVAAELLIAYRQEGRDVSWVNIETLNAPLAAPTAEELQAHYDENPETYTSKETRNISVAALTLETLSSTSEVTAEDIAELYEARILDYQSPERRLVERLVFGDQAQAEAAVLELANGASFEDLVRARGLTLSNVDLGDVSEADLGDAGAAVFAAAEGDVVGPVLSRVGPALFRINGSLAASETPLAEVSESLRNEIAMTKALEQLAIGEDQEAIEDLIAGGARIEDLASETAMEMSSLSWTVEDQDGLNRYAAVREAIPALEIGALPELVELADGGLVALRLDEIVAPALVPFAEVEQQVRDDFMAQATTKALQAQGAELADKLRAGNSADSLGLEFTTETELTRIAIPQAAPVGLIEKAFTMATGDIAVLDTPTGATVLRIDGESQVALTDDARSTMEARFADMLSQGLSEDIMLNYAGALRRNTEIRIDQSVVNAVNAGL